MPRTSIAASLALFTLIAFVGASCDRKEEAMPTTEAYFISPAGGETLTGQVKVVFGLKGMSVALAGVDKAGSGHHHLLIDVASLTGDALTEAIPSDDNYLHFGGGQTETLLDLEPGTHTLQIVLGDHNHVPHNPPVMSAQITITVE
jgi:hypothetical protein